MISRYSVCITPSFTRSTLANRARRRVLLVQDGALHAVVEASRAHSLWGIPIWDIDPMRIRSDSMIAGLPALRVREGLRRAARSQFASLPYLSRCFGTSIRRTKNLVTELVASGLLEPVEGAHSTAKMYRVTIAGGALSLASAAAPISRATADRKVRELIGRALSINHDDQYLYQVRRIVVFGSYLSNKPEINDVDLAVELEPRIKDRELLFEQIMKRSVKAEQGGRRFANMVERLYWPQTEVLLKLKSRSRGISLHNTDDAVLDNTPSREIFHAE